MARPKFKDRKFRESSTNTFIQGLKDAKQVQFLKQFEYDPRNRVAFIYSEGNSDAFQAVLEISKYAEQHYKINNFTADDSTTRYFTIFDKTAGTYADYIGLMQYALVESKCDSFLNAFCGHGERESYVRKIRYTKKSELSKNEKFIYEHFYFLLQKIEEDTDNFLRQKCSMNQTLYKNTYRELMEKLGADKTLYVRWKNEYYMYSLIKCYYSDAVFQYRDEWLGKQSLDVFVPSIKTGFEYQGLQHFEPVDFFGGEKSYIERIELDRIKKLKCSEEKISLIEWKYDEPVDRLTLEKKLHALQMTLPPRRNDLFSPQNYSNLKVNNIVQTRRRGNSDELLNNAIETKNKEQIYEIFMDLIQKKNGGIVQNSLLRMKESFSYREMLDLYMVICDREKFSRSFISLIVHNEELLNYYLNSRYCNYYTRKIILYMIKNEPDEEKIVQKINIMRKAYTSHDSLSQFKNRMQSAINEARENNVDREKVIRVLKKAKVIRANARLD